jgi:hypothetical protein
MNTETDRVPLLGAFKISDGIREKKTTENDIVDCNTSGFLCHPTAEHRQGLRCNKKFVPPGKGQTRPSVNTPDVISVSETCQRQTPKIKGILVGFSC